jgi:hypothetical protein
MSIGIRTAAPVLAAVLVGLGTLSATAQAKVPPEPHLTSPSIDCDVAVQLGRLADEGRRTRDLTVRRQIHHDLIQLLMDSRWSCG